MHCFFRTLLCFILSSNVLWGKPLKLSIGAESAILVNAKTGAILFEKEAHVPRFPASTTKIATALYSLHLCRQDLDRKMIATQEALASITAQAKKQSNYRSPAFWLETDGTHIGIKKGEEFSFRDLLYGMLLSSANDAANVVAYNLSGSVSKFVEDMNVFLDRIGCKKTHFNNPHGLHHPEHVTTAYDLSLMARIALQDPLFKQVASTVRHAVGATNLELERTLIQTNHLVRSDKAHYYPKAIGIKTGTTQAAGKNLVAAAEGNGRTLVAVTLGYRGDRDELYQDVVKMFESAFNEKKVRRYYLQKGTQSLTQVIKGGKQKLTTMLADGLFYEFFPSEETPVDTTITWEIPDLPLGEGSKVAVLRIKDKQGNVLQERALLAANTVEPTFFYRILGGNKKKSALLLLSLVGSVVLFFIIRTRRQRA